MKFITAAWMFLLVSLGVLMSSSEGLLTEPRHYEIPPNEPFQLELYPKDSVFMTPYSIPSDATHLMIQCHSQWQEVTLSQVKPPKPDNTMTGIHVALVMLLENGQTFASWRLDVNSTSKFNIDTIVLLTMLGTKDAIPGGCNSELPLENDPNIYALYDKSLIDVKFAFPNLGPKSRGSLQSCGDSAYMKLLRMELYMMWLPERDHSWKTFADSVLKMLSVDDITTNGTKVSEVYTHHSMTDQKFAGYVGQGVVYAVVIYTSDGQGGVVSAVAQPPVLTYACPTNGCPAIGLWQVAVTLILSVLGLALCFFGHRHFCYEVFLTAALSLHIIAFIVLAKVTDLTDVNCVFVGVVPAVVGGALWLWVWLWQGMPIVSLLSSSLLTGFIFSSILFNLTPLGGLDWWSTSLNFGMAFMCGVLLPVIVLVANPRALSVVSCGVVGSYIVILAVDILVQGSMRQVLLNTVRRSTQQHFLTAELLLPFQLSDIILSVAWFGLAVSSIIFQSLRERNRPHFPPHPWFKIWWEKRRNIPSSPINVTSEGSPERRPLLSGSPASNYSNSPVNINADILEQNTDGSAVA